MKRRDFIKSGLIAGAASVFSPLDALAQRSEQRNHIEYYRSVCNTLSGLRDYRNGQIFRQNRFAVAYFATPYEVLPNQGCATDAINIYSSINFARQFSGRDIDAVMVFTPLEGGNPAPEFADRITDPDPAKGNFYFKGLTADKERILAVAQDYRVAFDVNRHSGQIDSHSRSAVLISPRGELIAKYLPDHLPNMYDDIAKHIRDYEGRRISPVRNCEV